MVMLKMDDEKALRGVFSGVCTYCKHLKDPINYKCKAFEKVPEEIWMGYDKHRKRFKGDNGVLFAHIEK